MGSALSSLLSINNCGCGSLQDAAEIMQQIGELKQQITALEALLNSMNTNVSNSDAELAELRTLIKVMSDSINTLVNKMFDSMLPTFTERRHSEELTRVSI